MSSTIKLLIAIAAALSMLTVITVLANTIYLPQIPKYPTNTPTATLTATPTATATPTKSPTPTRTPTPVPGVYIIEIVYHPSSNPLDEYVMIENTGNNDVDLEGWWIKTETLGLKYIFPDFTLGEDDSVRVWTKSGNNTSRDLYWDRSSPVWDDQEDCAYLRAENGDLVDKYCYED